MRMGLERDFMDGMCLGNDMSVQSIAVLGAGQMGNGIAQVAACAGYDVTMIDINQDYLDKGMVAVKNSLSRVVKKERMNQDDADLAIAKISTSTDKNAASSADLVIEAIPEIPELKFSTFSEFDEICKPDAILASNTSSISINAIAKATNRPERVIGMHFMNPVPVMKLVEIINGSATSPEVTQLVLDACEKMDKIPLSCNDSPGFVSNRILCPMINEANLTLEEGVAEPEAIDGIMKLGMNHPIGPLALADLIGLDTILHIMNVLYEGFDKDPKYKPSQLLEDMVVEGKLGRKTGSGFYNYE